MRGAAFAAAICLTLLLAGCAGTGSSPSGAYESQSTPQEPAIAASTQQSDTENTAREDSEKETAEMKLNIDGTDVDVAWEDNQAAADLKALAAAGPVAVEMRRYGGFERVGPLGASLTASDV